ncbi:hypothetical protein [Streptomyces sp. NBC_01171]|uniref:hypothetical protein n=1 Tax=Streptomyces sp. NBC_01171 TaxID=2903757 RepID=UPI00386D23B9|nr:hypothetical protein OG448_13070 [Streptomyces sp. NBC_01171]
MEAPTSSDRTSNEISGASEVGGNAYQAKHMHFGGRQLGLTVVGLAAVGALTFLVVHANAGSGGAGQLAGAAQQSAAVTGASPAPSANSPSAKPSPSIVSEARDEKPPAVEAKPKVTRKAATPSTPYARDRLYCGEWRSSPSGSGLVASACSQITGTDAAFGVRVKNVSSSQVVVDVSVKYLRGGMATECPQGPYSMTKVRIDAGQVWYSNLGLCSARNMTTGNFQAFALAVENPDGDTDLKNGGPKYSPTADFTTDGELTCKQEDKSWGSCDVYRPQD